jgi:hypothetical protein
MEHAKSADEVAAGAQEQPQFLEAGMRAFKQYAIGFGHSDMAAIPRRVTAA